MPRHALCGRLQRLPKWSCDLRCVGLCGLPLLYDCLSLLKFPTYEYDKALEPRVMKCTLCYPRIVKGLLPRLCPGLPDGSADLRQAHRFVEDRPGAYLQIPDRYVDHIYGENEMGGTNWLYLSAVPFKEVGMREDLGITPAPKLTSGALLGVPIVVVCGRCCSPVFMPCQSAKRKLRIRKRPRRLQLPLSRPMLRPKPSMPRKWNRYRNLNKKRSKTRLKKALEEAAKPKEEDVSDTQPEEADKKPSEEES